MASTANPGASTAYDMSTMYFQFYSFSAKTAHEIACVMLESEHEDESSAKHEASLNSDMEKIKETYDAGSFGRYLARGQTDLVQLKKAINFEDDAIVNEVQQKMDEHDRYLYPDHPARTENSEVWKAAVARVKENFAGLRVPVDEQLVLYYDFHGFKNEAIKAILALKGTFPDSYPMPHQEMIIAKAKRDYAKEVDQPKDAQTLGEYLARGQVNTDDLKKFTKLDSEEIEEKIAHLHLEMIDENHDMHPDKSAVYSFAESKIAENKENYQP